MCERSLIAAQILLGERITSRFDYHNPFDRVIPSQTYLIQYFTEFVGLICCRTVPVLLKVLQSLIIM